MAEVNPPSSRRPPWLTPSAFVLVAANLLPLAGVLLFQWTVFEVVLLFWAENVVVGVMNVFRMLIASPRDPASWAMRLFLIPFFAFHYGMFTFAHGLFVLMLFGGETLNGGAFPEDLAPLLDAVSHMGLIIPLLALISSHAFSFLWNYVGKGEFRNAGLAMLMARPYGRVVVLHVTLIFGGFLVMSMGSPVGGLVLLLVLKVAFDLKAHVKEHSEKLEPDIETEPGFREILTRIGQVKPGKRLRTATQSPVDRGPEP